MSNSADMNSRRQDAPLGSMPLQHRSPGFQAASRHSRRVKILKWLLPLSVTLCVAAFGGVAWLNSYWSAAPLINVGTPTLSGDKVTMELPHMSGYNGQNQPYNVTAKSATQRINSLGKVELTDLEAVIGMADKSTATLKALVGQFDSQAKHLTLGQKVTVNSTKNYSVDLTSAEVDFESHRISSKEPVLVRTTSGTIQGGAMTILNEGETITFTAGVRATFQRKSNTEQSATATAQDMIGTTQ